MKGHRVALRHHVSNHRRLFGGWNGAIAIFVCWMGESYPKDCLLAGIEYSLSSFACWDGAIVSHIHDQSLILTILRVEV